MAESKDQLTGSREIRADIEETRSALDDIVSALASKLTPSQLLLEGWGLMKSGSGAGANRLAEVVRDHPLPSAVIGVGIGLLAMERQKRSDAPVRHAAGFTTDTGSAHSCCSHATLGETMGDMAHHVTDRATGVAQSVSMAGHDAKDAVAGVVGKAAAVLGDASRRTGAAASDASRKVVGMADTVRETTTETAAHLAEAAREGKAHLQEQAVHLKEQARVQVKDARIGFWQTMDQNPLAVGAAAIAVGLALGLAIPTTRKEGELMGDTRDNLLDEAKVKGQELLDRGKQVARTAAETAKSAAAAHDLTPHAIAEKVKSVSRELTRDASDVVRAVGRETGEAVKTEVATLMPDPNRTTGTGTPASMYNKTEPNKY